MTISNANMVETSTDETVARTNNLNGHLIRVERNLPSQRNAIQMIRPKTTGMARHAIPARPSFQPKITWTDIKPRTTGPQIKRFEREKNFLSGAFSMNCLDELSFFVSYEVITS